MRVRDLEIALVLAREMKAAAARSVDASLRLDQLQEVFGSPQLDHGERARIQTALQMAGLEPQPSLLEADPADAIRFSVAAKAAAPAGAGAGLASPAPPEADPAAEASATFPTVGQFARSKLGRSRRARRGDHAPPGGDHGDRNGGSARMSPMPDELDDVADEPFVPADELEAVTGAYEAPPAVDEAGYEPETDEPPEHDARAGDDTFAGDVHDEAHDDEPAPPDDEIHYEPPDAYERYDEAPAPELPPLVAPEPESAVAATPAPAGARRDEVVVALLPAVAIPVLVTSIAGWRFGLPFVALSVIVTGWLLGRRARHDGRRGGLLATLRSSPAAATAVKTTALVTVLGIGASVLLASVGKDSPTTSGHKAIAPAKKPAQPSAAAKPAKPAAKPKHKRHKPKAASPAKAQPSAASTTPSPAPSSTPPAATAASPPADPGTAGLVRVSPQSSGTSGTSGTPSGTGTTTTP